MNGGPGPGFSRSVCRRTRRDGYEARALIRWSGSRRRALGRRAGYAYLRAGNLFSLPFEGQPGIFIVRNGFRLFKGYPMLFPIGNVGVIANNTVRPNGIRESRPIWNRNKPEFGEALSPSKKTSPLAEEGMAWRGGLSRLRASREVKIHSAHPAARIGGAREY